MFHRNTVLVLAAVLLAAFPAFAIDSGLLGLVGPDAKVIVGANIDRVKTSPFGQFMLSEVQINERDFQNLLSATGFDPRRDLREVLAVSDNTAKNANGLVGARGTFDDTKLAALIAVQGGTVTTYQGVKILTGPAGSAGTAKDSGWVAFPEPGLALAGPSATVKAALDRRAANVRISPELAARIQSASSQYDIWIVSTVSPTSLAGIVPNGDVGAVMKGNVVQAIETVSGGFRFGSNVEMTGEAVTRSDRDASALADVVRFLASIAAANKDPKNGISALAESLEVTAQGNTVKLTITAPLEEVEKLFKPQRGAAVKKVVYRERTGPAAGAKQ